MSRMYLGAAIYPEIYGRDLPTLAQDIEYMKRGGFNVMRIGEFSWSLLEPHDGEYDLEWLHRIVDTLGENGISVILCTPTATPPDWLTRKYPETLEIDESGRRRQHGARRHCCSNSRVYRDYSMRIVERLAREFAADPNVIGWQLDNEIATHDRGCSCPECMRKFHMRLRRRFGTVEELNRAWSLSMWSQNYESFEDVPHPDKRTWSNPSLIAEYADFCSDSHAEFLHLQADTLRRCGVLAPIGTDMMPIFNQDYPTTVAPLDVVQFNHYNSLDDLWRSAFWFNYCQNLKPETPFWNTETSTSYNDGASAPTNRYPLGFCRINSLLPFAFGGEANCYWLWRAHPSGHELMHGSVLSTQGRPVYNFNEIKEVSAILEKAGDFLSGTRAGRTDFAMSVSCKAGRMFGASPLVNGFSYSGALLQNYRSLFGTGMLPALMEPKMPLDGVRVLYSPYLLTLEEGDFAERLEAWILAGGIWIAGPLTDIRNAELAKYPDSPFGLIERLTGVYNDFGLPASAIPASVEWDVGDEPYLCDTALWTDAFTLSEGMEQLGAYRSADEPSPLDSRAAAAFCPAGRGGVLLLGTSPDAAALRMILKYAFDKADIRAGTLSDSNVIVVERSGKRNGLVLAEVEHSSGCVRLDGCYRDLITGETLSGTIELAPYDFRVLEATGE